MAGRIEGKRIAILCTHGVELLELIEPRQALEDAGAKTVLIAPAAGKIRAWNMTEWDREFDVDMPLTEASHQEFDALHLPGGPLNAEILRADDFAVFFVNEFFFKRNKPVSALCHAPWILVEADLLRGRKVTSYPAIATDLQNAGAHWLNHAVVVDGNLVTGRHPADTPEFNPAMIELFATYKGDPSLTAGGLPRTITRDEISPKSAAMA